jgi:hypothetical protein
MLEAFRRPVIIVARTFVLAAAGLVTKTSRPVWWKPAGNVSATAHDQGQACMLRIW